MEPDRPNPPANEEPAAGARETARTSEIDREKSGTTGDNVGGITNRPLDREQQEQNDVPPRGQTKDEERNA